jgi:hypothetical protein
MPANLRPGNSITRQCMAGLHKSQVWGLKVPNIFMIAPRMLCILFYLTFWSNLWKQIFCEISGSHGGEHEDESSGILQNVVSQKLTDASTEALTVFTTLMMEAVSTSEKRVNFQETTYMTQDPRKLSLSISISFHKKHAKNITYTSDIHTHILVPSCWR